MVRAAARAAEDAADLRGALRLVRRLPASPESLAWRAELEAVTAGDTDAVDPALFLRWLTRPVLRWALERPLGDTLRQYASLLLLTRGHPAAERERHLLHTCLTSPVVIDGALFDAGVLRRYLAEAAAPAVASSVMPLGWWRHPFSVWRVLRAGPGRVELADLYDLSECTSLPWSSAATARGTVPPAARTGQLVAGRLVPMPPPGSTAPGEPMGFVVPPFTVDQRCAARLLRARQRGAGAEERVRAVARYLRRVEP